MPTGRAWAAPHYLHIAPHHYHRYADLPEVIQLLKCLSDIFCPDLVSKFRSVLAIIFHAIYGAVCIKLTHFSYDDGENTCTWSYDHHQIGNMTSLPLFSVRACNNGMRCMSFYILMHPNVKLVVRILTLSMSRANQLLTSRLYSWLETDCVRGCWSWSYWK